MADDQANRCVWMTKLEDLLENSELKIERDTSTGLNKLIDMGFFEANPNAALKTVSDIKLRYVSKKHKPSLLLSNLPIDGTKLEEEKPLKYIADNAEYGPCTFYGTSGAGKTRRLFEFLSLNHGLYFLADKGRNPGSTDFNSSISMITSQLEDCIAESETQDYTESEFNLKAVLETSEENYGKVANIVGLLIKTRITIFLYIKAKLGRAPTPYEWLLLQVSPKSFFSGKLDVFNAFFVAMKNVGVADDDSPKCFASFNHHMHCFIDEAQELTRKMENKFVSAAEAKNGECVQRTAYSAYLKGFMKAQTMIGFFKYPLFCGTGLSLHDIVEESISVTVKPEQHEPIFKDFGPLTEEDVISYMKGIVDLDGIGDDLISHAAKWLRGRPRWTATFIETFLEQKDKVTGFVASRGEFESQEGPFIRSVDRYIGGVTSEEGSTSIGGCSDANGLSWSTGTSGAYHAVKRLTEKALSDQLQINAREDLMRNVCAFALSGESQTVDDHSAKLIELGIASTVVEVQTPGYVTCRIDEPLIIQSCINRFQIKRVVALGMISSKNDVEKGIAFENFLLPQLQQNWKNVLTELKDQGDFGDYDVPTLSSYGVLSKVCKEPSETLSWLEKSTNARFEGTVEPFCMPDILIGPDILSLMRNNNFGKRLLAVQSKLRYKVNQLDALRTIQPAMFYFENRSKKAKLNSQMKEEDAKLWLDIQNSLLLEEEPPTKIAKIGEDGTLRQRTQQIVRMLVQFPAERSRNSASGLVAFTEVKVTAKKGKNDKLDALLVIDRNNAEKLLGVDEQNLIKLLKQIDGRECPDTFDIET